MYISCIINILILVYMFGCFSLALRPNKSNFLSYKPFTQSLLYINNNILSSNLLSNKYFLRSFSNYNNLTKMSTNGQVKGDWVRKQFIDYFVSKNHVHWPSSSVLPNNDPTLLFVNAGMNQFKDIIMGKSDENSEFGKLKMVCNSQKCIRAGGKHNDLDDVGQDCYHQTYFEMLGNWSFGAYFKEEAISYAWDLLTNVYKLDPNRLYVTYFGGDKSCEVDNETREIWLKFMPASRILPFGSKDNFWEMADTGPCGPCTEIHYDHIGGRDASTLVNADDPNVVEIWNIVFMQYNRGENGVLERLPKGCVDTGMGLERLCSVLNNTNSNYNTDLLNDIIQYIRELLPGFESYKGGNTPLDVAYRVVSDHVRCLSVAISDKVYPSNEGRGYVLRRILRRAVRYCRDYFNTKEPFLYKLVPSVTKLLGNAYPNLLTEQANIESIVLDEEKLFLQTLDKGVEKFKKMVSKSGNKVINGPDAFLLYQSYGFPLDLTMLMARELGITVDVDGYYSELKLHQQKSESRVYTDLNSLESRCDKLLKSLSADRINTILKMCNNVYTDDKLKYDWDSSDPVAKVYKAKLVSTVTLDSVMSELQCDDDDLVCLVMDRTPFYAEGGGQIYDTGYINDLEVLRVYKMSGLVFHFCLSKKSGVLRCGDEFELKVDYERRVRVASNHTSTHILNFVLRDMLDESSYQRGSQLDEEKLKFDYCYNQQLPEDLIRRIEDRMMDFVRSEAPLRTREIEYKNALEIPGIRANFDEKYPEVVRVVNVQLGSEDFSGEHTSTEVCGGTHLTNTKTIQDVAVVGEEGISKGVRRLTLVTNEQCRKSKADLLHYEKRLEELEKNLKPINFTKDDTREASLNAAENMTRLTALRGEAEVHKMLPLLGKRNLMKKFEQLIDQQVSAGKAHQKRLANIAKMKAVEVVEKLQSQKYDEVEFTEKTSEHPAVLRASVDDLEGDLKSLNVFVQTISKTFPQIAVLASSVGINAVCCRVNSPNASYSALKAANLIATQLNLTNGTGIITNTLFIIL
ncbi:alanyl-tRNA synthetase, putative [Theileria annulata]|uniref:Alanine--tRNA ligase n=1 Tax=Theileria annulata TaxID=5874 RepID=Q4UIJ4_THEAN|nr:alanyl-tRNA synthetase, putative [Theileria annulata]CAI73095.1 alanyl-tRNA synthetase, putative [Theileria annulata]|eukprot:XP_953773.1 alanyl-tRNA synthetase, putative [Theileria annulata]